MQTIEIFIIDSIFPAIFLTIAGYFIYALLSSKNKYPKYCQGQTVLGQNYKTKNGDYVPCQVTRVITVWHSRTKFDHMYECKVMDANIALELNEERVKPYVI